MAGSLAASLGKDNPYRFKGYYYDEETGMYYLKSRYYQPEICRFISADDEDVLSVKTDFDDCNLYAYCDNNPISRLDKTGDVWQAALAGGWVIGGSNAWNPVGWAILGTTAVVGMIAIGVLYSKTKSKRNRRSKNKAKNKSKKGIKERVNQPTARRYRFNSRKKAKQAALRAGKGKIRNDYSKKGAHYHPEVKTKYRRTPKGNSSHDHYYYPR